MKRNEKFLTRNEKGEYVGVVYRYQLNCHESKKDGWSYVGNTPEEAQRRRMWGNPNNAYAGKKIAEARAEFGLSKFDYEVLETITDTNLDRLLKRLEELETLYIQKYDSVQNGFNASAGGTGRKGEKIGSEEIKARNAKRVGFSHSDATKKQISNANTGRVVSQETRDKISKGNSGKKRTEEQRKAESNRLKGITPVAACEGAKEWRKRNGGGYWRGKKMNKTALNNMKAAQQRRGIKVAALYPDGTKVIFPSLLDAAKGTNVGVGSVHYSMNNNSQCKNGIKFIKI